MKEMLIEGRSIDEAIENACSAFGVPREKLRIEIVSEGSAGFLGIGAKKVQIRASLLAIDLIIDTPIAARQSVEPGAPESRIHEPDRTPKPRVTRTPAVHHRTNGEKSEDRKVNEPVSVTRSAFAGTGEGDESAREKAKRMLEGLLMRMQIDSPVSVEETEEAIILNIQGDGSGFLIGKRGQNLDAIQYIVSKAVHHSVNGHKMIIIDTEGYRQRREESLVALALRFGDKVKKTKKPLTVGFMNAHDRRVIHMALQTDATLTTKSRGEGEYRKILILPVRQGREPADG